MPTTGGALAFQGFTPPYEATLTKNLRDARSHRHRQNNLIELANWVAGAPTPMAAYNAVAGFGFNPYDPRPDPRETSDGRAVLSPGGSSSGAGTASSFWAANVGSDTGGSIVQPSNQAMLVGLRPTLGRNQPLRRDPDYRRSRQPPDPWRAQSPMPPFCSARLKAPRPTRTMPPLSSALPPAGRDYTKFLKADSLKGARIGIPRVFYYDSLPPAPGETRRRGGLNPAQAQAMADAIEALKKQGAVIVDPVELPSFVDKDPKNNFLQWPYCSGADQAKGKDNDCSVNFKYGMKRDFNNWLQSLGPRRARQDPARPPAMECGPRQSRRDQIRTVANRYFRRDGRGSGSRPQ